MPCLWIALLAMGLWVPAQAQVYKWVDEKGVTQYGQKPPADHKGQKMKLPDAPPAAARGASAAKDPLATVREQDTEFKRRQIARQEAEAKDFQEAASRKQWCIEARDDLERKRHARIYDLNAKGERVFKSDANRDAFLAGMEAEYKQHCK
ncbi:DUF4124 domain-containing protein [Polaromonas sp.]|uniref:DUF4124 domain-containing protein n=1 Tax=Polaromonas sp. TaxID=1869339 RepID=UPI002731A9A8|nr:DUF4124 domain-containing protein [Polaromonas sp.]MDP1742764.1 DUF4124 domain-containing protein [Polaromonas sp.]